MASNDSPQDFASLQSDAPPPPLAHRLAWVVLAVFIAGMAGVAIWKRMDKARSGSLTMVANSPLVPSEDETLPRLYPIPEFKLTDQNGEEFGSAQLKGRVWIVNFVFTRCMGTCISMTQSMVMIDRELDVLKEKEIRLVSLSMDPEYDKPEVLAKYAQAHNAVSDRWHFLTGDKAAVHKLTEESFKLVMRDGDPNSKEPIIHSEKFALVDGDGNMRACFSCKDLASIHAMIEAACRLETIEAENRRKQK